MLEDGRHHLLGEEYVVVQPSLTDVVCCLLTPPKKFITIRIIKKIVIEYTVSLWVVVYDF